MAEESLKHKTKIGMLWTFLNQFVNYVLQFVVGIIMARLLTPEDYGITALPAVFMMVAQVFQDCGFSSALIRKTEVTDNDLSTAFYYSTSVGVMCYVLLFFGAPYIADFYETPVLIPLIRVSTLGFLWGPLITPQTVMLNRRLDFKTPTKISVTTKILSAIIGIAMAYYGYGLWSLVAYSLAGSLLSLILTFLVVRWLPSAGWSKDSFKYLFGFGGNMLLVNVIDKIYQNISPMFIGKFYSPTQLGYYNRALGYANLPSQNIMNTINTVTFPVLSKIKDDNEHLGAIYRKMISVSAFVVFPLMILLAVLARPLIICLITDKWIECVSYLQLMCFWLMLAPIHGLNFQLLMVKGRTDMTLKAEIMKKSLCLIIMLITLPLGIKTFIIGSIASSFLCLIINAYFTGKLIKVGFFTQFKDILPSLVISSVVMSGVYLLIAPIANIYFQIALGSISAFVSYLGIAYLLGRSELKDLKYFLKK